jgi:predicted dehydrogenase
MEPLRIGVLGAARIAEDGTVMPARLTAARLVALVARNRRLAQAFHATHGVERGSRYPTPTWSSTPRSRQSTTRWRKGCILRGT